MISMSDNHCFTGCLIEAMARRGWVENVCRMEFPNPNDKSDPSFIELLLLYDLGKDRNMLENFLSHETIFLAFKIYNERGKP